MTIDVVPPEFIISVENTESKSTLWTRVSASIRSCRRSPCRVWKRKPGRRHWRAPASRESNASVAHSYKQVGLQQARLRHLPRRRAQRHPLQMSQSKHHQLRQQLPAAAMPLLSQRDRRPALRIPSLLHRSEREGSSPWCRWSATSVKASFFEV